MLEKQIDVFSPIVGEIEYGSFHSSDLKDLLTKCPYVFPEKVKEEYRCCISDKTRETNALQLYIKTYYYDRILSKLKLYPERYTMSVYECVKYAFFSIAPYANYASLLYFLLIFWLSIKEVEGAILFSPIGFSTPLFSSFADMTSSMLAGVSLVGAVFVLPPAISRGYRGSLQKRIFTYYKIPWKGEMIEIPWCFIDFMFAALSVSFVLFACLLLAGYFDFAPYSISQIVNEILIHIGETVV